MSSKKVSNDDKDLKVKPKKKSTKKLDPKNPMPLII